MNEQCDRAATNHDNTNPNDDEPEMTERAQDNEYKEGSDLAAVIALIQFIRFFDHLVSRVFGS